MVGQGTRHDAMATTSRVKIESVETAQQTSRIKIKSVATAQQNRNCTPSVAWRVALCVAGVTRTHLHEHHGTALK